MKCARGEVSFGDKWVYERLTAKKCVWKRGWAIEGRKRGESALCAVQYNLALWFLSRGHVANFPTDGIHFLYFTFPWTPCFTLCFAPTLSGSRSPLPSSSAPAVIRGKVSHRATATKCNDVTGGFLVQKMLTFGHHFGLMMEAILLSKGSHMPQKQNYRRSWCCRGKVSNGDRLTCGWPFWYVFCEWDEEKVVRKWYSPRVSICPRPFHLLLDSGRPPATFSEKVKDFICHFLRLYFCTLNALLLLFSSCLTSPLRFSSSTSSLHSPSPLKLLLLLFLNEFLLQRRTRADTSTQLRSAEVGSDAAVPDLSEWIWTLETSQHLGRETRLSLQVMRAALCLNQWAGGADWLVWFRITGPRP